MVVPLRTLSSSRMAYSLPVKRSGRSSTEAMWVTGSTTSSPVRIADAECMITSLRMQNSGDRSCRAESSRTISSSAVGSLDDFQFSDHPERQKHQQADREDEQRTRLGDRLRV